MTQPWDWWHTVGAGGLTVFNARELQESAGVIGGGNFYVAPHMLSARPFFVGDDGIALNRVGLNMQSTAMVGNCRFGIYKCPPPSAHDMFPSELVADLGELPLSGTFLRFRTVSPSLKLSAGFHYIATLFDNALTITTGYGLMGGPGMPIGYSPVTGAALIGFSTQFNYGALPATFPAIPTTSFGVFGNTLMTGQAIYFEMVTTGTGSVSLIYNAATPAGTAVINSDTLANVQLLYGPNTSPATVAAVLESAVNIVTARSIGSAANMPAGIAFSEAAQPAGPIQSVNANAGRYIPMTSIDVDA